MNHECVIRDADHHFIIDPVTRSVTNSGSKKTKLMQLDHNSECFSFGLDREVEGHDMSECNVVRIHYNNIESGGVNSTKGLYEVKDLTINQNDESQVLFSWTITDEATRYPGPLSFIIEFKCVDADGKVTYRWWTDINSSISISAGINNDEYIAEEYADILAQWKAEIDEALAQGGLTEEQAADLAANTEARHTHDNEEILDRFGSYVGDGESDGMPLYDGVPLWTNSHGGVVTGISHNDTTGKTKIKFRKYADFSIPVEEYVIDTPTKTSELVNDSGFITKGGIPAVHELPIEAKDGDMCLYAPANIITLEDSGKRIYFDWEEIAKPVTERERIDFNLFEKAVSVGNVSLSKDEGGRNSFALFINQNNYQLYLCVCFSNGVIYPDYCYIQTRINGETVRTTFDSINELPLYHNIASFDTIERDPVWNINIPNVALFYTSYRLMMCQGGEWVELIPKADEEDTMDTMAEMGLIDPVTLSDGSIITSNNNEIYTL